VTLRWSEKCKLPVALLGTWSRYSTIVIDLLSLGVLEAILQNAACTSRDSQNPIFFFDALVQLDDTTELS
jgi:hypothetical protein